MSKLVVGLLIVKLLRPGTRVNVHVYAELIKLKVAGRLAPNKYEEQAGVPGYPLPHMLEETIFLEEIFF